MGSGSRKEGSTVRHEAVQEMEEGPSESTFRSRLQTTLSCVD